MKKISTNAWSAFGLFAAILLLASCGNQHKPDADTSPDEEATEVADEMRSEVDDSTNLTEEELKRFRQQLENDSIGLEASVFGKKFFYSDKSAGMDGSNISIKYESSKINLYRTYVDKGGKVSAIGPKELNLDGSNSVKIVLDEITVDNKSRKVISIYDVTDDPIAGKKKTWPVGSFFDLKMSKGTSATGDDPAIVGMDDARDARVGESDGFVGSTSWDGKQEILIEAGENDQDEPVIIVSSSAKKPIVFTNKCIWLYGLTHWGYKYEYERQSCP